MSGSSSSTSARKLIPKALDDALYNIPKFKAPSRAPKPRSVADILQENVESAMYDEIMGPLVQKRPQPSLNLPLREVKPGAEGSDKFNSSIIARLTGVEAEASKLRHELAAAAHENQSITEENDILRLQCSDALHLSTTVRTQRKTITDLEQQIREMKAFLEDYGLVWVGNEGSFETNGNIIMPSFAKFLEKITELNDSILSQPAIVKIEARKARLVNVAETLENITVSFYQNGLMIQRGPFRLFESESCQSFIADVMDGYFPTEFRDQCPEGIMLDLKDRHDQIYQEGNVDDGQCNRLAAAQLLNRIPKSVVRNGEIIDLREDVKGLLQLDSSKANSDGQACAGESGQAAAKQKSQASVVVIPSGAADALSNGTCLSQDCTQLVIKWFDGSQFQLCMFRSDCVKDIRLLLGTHLASHNTNDNTLHMVELRTSFPARTLTNDMTLSEAGLVPNGIIHARLTKH